MPGSFPFEPIRKHPPLAAKAFTLLEMLIVVAVIGILSALIITAISNAAEDSRLVIARQQQAILQEALSAWISKMSSGTNSIATARTMYSTANTSLAKMTLIHGYMDSNTYEHFSTYTTDPNQIQTEAMAKAGVYLQFSSWSTNSYPRVNMVQ